MYLYSVDAKRELRFVMVSVPVLLDMTSIVLATEKVFLEVEHLLQLE